MVTFNPTVVLENDNQIIKNNSADCELQKINGTNFHLNVWYLIDVMTSSEIIYVWYVRDSTSIASKINNKQIYVFDLDQMTLIPSETNVFVVRYCWIYRCYHKSEFWRKGFWIFDLIELKIKVMRNRRKLLCGNV